MLIACPSCQRQLNVPDHAAGKQVRCPAPDCGTIFTVAAPPPTAVQAAAPMPAAAPQPVVGGAPFDFGGGAGPEADFGFTAHDDGGLKGIGVRTRLNYAGGWLNMAAGSMILFMLVSIGLQIGSLFAVRGHEIPWIGLIGGTCAALLLVPCAIVVAIGGRMLSHARRRGFVMAAAIVSLVVGGVSLLLLVVWVVFVVIAAIAAAASAPESKFVLLNSCGNALFSGILAFCSIFGGVAALRTLLNAELKKTFT